MRLSRGTRLQLQLQKYLFILLLLAAAGLLAWLSNQHSMQFDWTANRRNTLSQSSIELLRALKHPVNVNVYTQDDNAVHTAVDEIMKRYQRFKSDFHYRLLNPDIDIESAQLDKISEYGQYIIDYNGRKETVTSLSENAISSALLRLSRSGGKSVVFLTGHGERNPAGDNNISYTKLAGALSLKGITSEALNLMQSAIPDDTGVLVIAAPDHELGPGELEHIDKYIERGGNLFWLMDPGSMQGMDELAHRLGMRFLDGIVVDNNTNLRETLRIQHPAMIPVLDYFPHAITRNLQYNTLFPISRGIEQVDDNWQASVIAQSLPQSWAETSQLGGEFAYEPENGDVQGPIKIIMALERVLIAPADKHADKPVKASQRVVIAGDSDFLANSYIGAGANLQLGLNIINWLSGDDDLIAVEPRQAPDTKLQLDDTETLIIGAGFFLVLPSALFAAGLIIWFKRRKR
jgi:gliding motility-associatede transport system auxiliary component